MKDLRGVFLTALSSLRGLFAATGDPDEVVSAIPLVDYIDTEDCPLYSILPQQSLPVIDDVLVTNAWTAFDGDDFVLGADFHLDVLPELQFPGLSQMSIRFDPLPAAGELRIGSGAWFNLTGVGLTLTFDPVLLNKPGTTDGAELVVVGDIELSSDGLKLQKLTKADLRQCEVAGTGLLLDVAGIALGSQDTLFTLDKATITLPKNWGSDKDGNPIVIDAEHASWGKYGLSGAFSLQAGAGIETELFGLDVTLQKASISLVEGALDDARLSGTVDISSFAKNSDAHVIDVDFHIGTGGITASLRGEDDEPVASIEVKDLLSLEVSAIRLDGPASRGTAAPPILWLSGTLTPTIEGDWPAFDFDEIGLDSKGGIHLAAGASVATTSPFSVDWSFVELTVSAFALSRPRDAPDDIELGITASVQLMEGLPAGISVDGLVARWNAKTNDVDLRFDGIGVEFGVPGAFLVEADFAFKNGGFKGHGTLVIDSLDISLDILADAHPSADGSYNTLFLTAESALFPGGIPIGATATSLYGISGLLAINRELDVKPDTVGTPPRPDPQRFFNLFDEDEPAKGRPRGFAAPAKWRDAQGSTSIGLGVLIGTSDDGWTISARGALLLTLPELSLLLTATGDILAPRKPLSAGGKGNISALLAILPGEGLMRLDMRANWSQKPLFEMGGAGGGIFYFDDPTRFRLWAGQPPETGAMMSASFCDISDHWWLTAGGWFALDASRQASVGAYAPLSLRFGIDEFYAEIAGTARAELTTAWSPVQAFGKLVVDGNACLAIAGLRLVFGVHADVGVELANPTDVRLHIEACHEIDLWLTTIKICLGFTFGFSNRDMPSLDSVPFDVAFAPRQWTPIPNSAGTMDDGVVASRQLQPAAVIDLGTVQPHSAISLAFPGAMTIDPAVRPVINAPTILDPLPEAISGGSGLLRNRRLEALELIDSVDPATPLPLSANILIAPTDRPGVTGPLNQFLELWSKRHFKNDGSVGGGGAEQTPDNGCDPDQVWIDCSEYLADLNAGARGHLKVGWPYDWVGGAGIPRNNHLASELRPGETITIWPIHSLDTPRLHWANERGASADPDQWALFQTDLKPEADGQFVLNSKTVGSEGRILLVKLTWRELVAASGAQHHGQTHPGSPGGTLPLAAEDRILLPGHSYVMTVQAGGQLLDRGNTVLGNAPTGPTMIRFTAAHAPLHAGALTAAVAGVYPADGARPIFLDYDLTVRFAEDWTEALYRLDQRPLAVRLIDGDGKPVKGADGLPALLPTWRTAAPNETGSEKWWRDDRGGTACEPPPPPAPITIMPIELGPLGLKPHARYTAEVIAPLSADRADILGDALYSWSFTTSGFADYAALVAPPSVPATARSLFQASEPVADDFDTLIRSFGSDSVALAATMRITPVLRGNMLVYLLLEAPEPLDDEHSRLSIGVVPAIRTPKDVRHNKDWTRILVCLTPTPLTTLGSTIFVTLDWIGAPLEAPIEAVRSRNGIADSVHVQWTVPLGATA